MNSLNIQGIALTGITVAIAALVYWWNRSSHRLILSSYMLLVMLLILQIVYVASNATVDHPLINFVSLMVFVTFLSIPPTMYIYVDQYLSEHRLTKTISERLPSYYLPIGLLLINLCAYILIYQNTPDSIYTTISGEIITYTNFIALFFIFLLQNFYFVYKALNRYSQHKKEAQEVFSSETASFYSWVRSFIIGYIIFIVGLYLTQLGLFKNNLLLVLFIGLYFGYILYHGFRSPAFSELIAQAAGAVQPKELAKATIDSINPLSSYEDEPVSSKSKNKELNDSIPPDLQSQIWQNVELLMQEEKVFLQKELTLYTLAKLAQTNSKYLRFTIKEKTEKNFAAYVNQYRIREAQNLLMSQDADRYTIAFIGESAGFKAKSAFYLAFKEVTGMTPKQFQGKMKSQHLS